MTRLLIILAIAIAGAIAFTTLELDRQLSIEAEAWSLPAASFSSAGEPKRTPLELPLATAVVTNAALSDHLRLTLSGRGYDYVGVLIVRFKGDNLRVTIQGSDAFVKRPACLLRKKEIATCRLVVRANEGKRTFVTIGAETGQATILGLEYETAVAKRQSAASAGELFYAFLFLLLLGPVLVWLRRIPNAEQYALAVLGMCWLAYTSVSGLAASIALAAGGYFSIRLVAAAKNNRTRNFLTLLTGIVLAIIFVKFVAPVAAGAFANPGGFALALPLGISYFAVRIVDLMLTAYAGALKQLTIRDYAAFLFMPHTLPAGPILTYENFLTSRISSYSYVDFSAGMARMAVGFGKKLIADAYLLPLVGASMSKFLTAGDNARPEIVATMLICNVAYVYLDFSAYCDIAIGAARAGGRRVPENFDWPLVRSSILDFWRHWHMTLSNWVMRRVYFPAFLTSRSPTLSIVASMMVIGLWHTPNVSWVLWACHHGLAMSSQRVWFPATARKPQPTSSVLQQALRIMRRLAGIAFVWIWVALGHSFTLFSSLEYALRSYLTALSLPVRIVWRLIS